jgi:hypothetical protein
MGGGNYGRFLIFFVAESYTILPCPRRSSDHKVHQAVYDAAAELDKITIFIEEEAVCGNSITTRVAKAAPMRHFGCVDVSLLAFQNRGFEGLRGLARRPWWPLQKNRLILSFAPTRTTALKLISRNAHVCSKLTVKATT